VDGSHGAKPARRKNMKVKDYLVIYGGQEWIRAESEEEAYRKFRETIKRVIDERRMGLIAETYEVPEPEEQTDEPREWSILP
jgi:hypothetical protein